MKYGERLAIICDSVNSINQNTQIKRNESKNVNAQIGQILSLLEKKAKKGETDLRIDLSYGLVHHDVIKYFKEEGFIVWENDATILFRIPTVGEAR